MVSILNIFFEEKGSEFIEVLCEFEESKKEVEKLNFVFNVLKEFFVLKDKEVVELRERLSDFYVEKEIMS